MLLLPLRRRRVCRWQIDGSEEDVLDLAYLAIFPCRASRRVPCPLASRFLAHQRKHRWPPAVAFVSGRRCGCCDRPIINAPGIRVSALASGRQPLACWRSACAPTGCSPNGDACWAGMGENRRGDCDRMRQPCFPRPGL